MGIVPGTRIGVYEVLSAIGAGGMGEVYRARDTTLNREVALKILPASFAVEPDRLLRFRREAQVLATLNHESIATIYGFEESGGTQALVLELVDGETLADRIARGPVPVDEALAIARQIADALAAAHEHGIVHRDLKPANIKLTVRGAPPPRNEDGHLERRLSAYANASADRRSLGEGWSAADVADCRVKVLDFGLAKALEPARATGTDQLTASPTVAPAMETGPGVVLGTAAYMSPEQAKGRAVDQRADIWALGCVVYEMLTGTPPFAGESVAETLSAVLTREPDWTRLPETAPETLRRTLGQCLRKDVASRRRSAADLVLEFSEQSLGIPQATRTAPPRRLRAGTVAVLIVTAAFAAAATWAFAPRSTREPGSERHAMRFSLQLPAGLSLRMPAGGSSIAVSPDGSTIAYLAENADGLVRLYVQRLDRDGPVVVEGSSMAQGQSFSPDGLTIAFLAGTDLLIARTDGTAARAIATRVAPPGLPGAAVTAWTDADTVLVGHPRSGTGVKAYSVGTGTISDRTMLAGDETGHTWLAPGSTDPANDALLLATWPGRRVMFQPRRGVGLTPVLDGAVAPRVVGQDLLVFSRESGIWASRFDQRTGRVGGRPQAVLQNLAVNSIGNPLFAVSPTGILVYQASPEPQPVVVRWLDRRGAEEAVAIPEGTYAAPAIAPDGLSVSMSMVDFANPQGSQSPGLWTFRRGRAGPALLHRGRVTSSIWSSDGRTIFFTTIGGDLLSGPADGRSPATVIGKLPPGQASVIMGLTPDGQGLIFSATFDLQKGPEIGTFDLTGRREATPLLREEGVQDSAALSPDGRWLAYSSTQSGISEIYVRPYPDVANGRWKVSESGGTEPRWTRGGRELLYWSAANELMSVQLTGDAPFTTAQPVRLIDKRVSPSYLANRYDVTRDGEWMIVASPSSTPWTQLSVILNWDVELREKLGQDAEAQ